MYTAQFGVSLYLLRLFSPLIFRTWNRALSTNMSHWLQTTKHLDPVVQKVDNAIHWINLYPVDNAIDFPNTVMYLLVSTV